MNLIADFVGGLDRINALADRAPGFVWRLETEDGNATAVRPVEDDELLAIKRLGSSQPQERLL